MNTMVINGAFLGALATLLAVFLTGCGGSLGEGAKTRHVADTVGTIAAEVCEEHDQAEACLVKCLDEYRRRKEEEQGK